MPINSLQQSLTECENWISAKKVVCKKKYWLFYFLDRSIEKHFRNGYCADVDSSNRIQFEASSKRERERERDSTYTEKAAAPC